MCCFAFKESFLTSPFLLLYGHVLFENYNAVIRFQYSKYADCSAADVNAVTIVIITFVIINSDTGPLLYFLKMLYHNNRKV